MAGGCHPGVPLQALCNPCRLTRHCQGLPGPCQDPPGREDTLQTSAASSQTLPHPRPTSLWGGEQRGWEGGNRHLKSLFFTIKALLAVFFFFFLIPRADLSQEAQLKEAEDTRVSLQAHLLLVTPVPDKQRDRPRGPHQPWSRGSKPQVRSQAPEKMSFAGFY